jgi:hypothetical protein
MMLQNEQVGKPTFQFASFLNSIIFITAPMRIPRRENVKLNINSSCDKNDPGLLF